ncbi:nuclear transport factor 2 family protein [Microbulbifer sp. VAAF005]|uniref:nuclear transport factor 2 family protein n=1 Tax=Microbulbifer sp. VAAF005 TaxID=3034230 RepID=UPI0024AE412E|nr:nuclear transport factor 2 family protein [Microbulbifer sp. VAAF005]WHI45198.1 nuclear transport factor 2 family protein [Microbulbifer sp. VAAF005]
MEYNDDEKYLIQLWETHTEAEFDLKDADAAIATMTENPVLIHVPVNTGATGKEPLRKFYRDIFIPQMPADINLQLLSRTVGKDSLVDEFILHFTHSIRMDWFAPGIGATGKKLSIPHVGIISFSNRKISSEHIYWDQATVLDQLGILQSGLPVTGSSQCHRLLNSNSPTNELLP